MERADAKVYICGTTYVNCMSSCKSDAINGVTSDLKGQRVLYRKNNKIMIMHDNDVHEGHVLEVAPSGDYINLAGDWIGENRWFSKNDVTIIEVLGPILEPVGHEKRARDGTFCPVPYPGYDSSTEPVSLMGQIVLRDVRPVY